jgi:hypothetical protein
MMGSDIIERDMDPATRWRVVRAIQDEVGCSEAEAIDAVFWFEMVDSSEGRVLH